LAGLIKIIIKNSFTFTNVTVQLAHITYATIEMRNAKKEKNEA
jgi:hypothetical protein